MSDKTKKEVYATDYMSLFDDGTIGLDDGVGYLDTLDKEKVFKLYMALKKFVESNETLFEEVKPEPLDGKISKEMIRRELDVTNMRCGVKGCKELVTEVALICAKDVFDENGGRFFISDGEFETVWECKEHGTVSAVDGDKKYSKPTELMNMKIVCIDDNFFINLDIVKSTCGFYLRYKDNPDLLVVEYPEYRDKIVELKEKLPSWFVKKTTYNEWLFKLAFRDVFREVEK